MMVPRVQQVMRQAKARIFRGDTRSEGKIVSLFEPSTEVIRKGKASKPTEFGKLVKLQEAENQIIVDYEVYAQRPNDSDLLIPAIEVHAAKLGRIPRLVAADAGFYSAKNEAAAKAKGVKRVCIPNRCIQERRAQARAEEAMVPQRPAMAHRVRGTHQCEQAPTRSQPVPISRRRWNEALGRPRGHRRQPHQYRPRDRCRAGHLAAPSPQIIASAPPVIDRRVNCFRPGSSARRAMVIGILRRKVASPHSPCSGINTHRSPGPASSSPPHDHLDGCGRNADSPPRARLAAIRSGDPSKIAPEGSGGGSFCLLTPTSELLRRLLSPQNPRSGFCTRDQRERKAFRRDMRWLQCWREQSPFLRTDGCGDGVPSFRLGRPEKREAAP